MRLSDFAEGASPMAVPKTAERDGSGSHAGELPDGSEPTQEASSLVWPVILGGLMVFLTVRAGFGALVVVIGFVFMIFMHELGHYLTAKAAGMKVTQFFLGFGPKLWSFHRGETEYGLKAIPAGAYVRIIGMNNLDPVDLGDAHRAYRVAPYWRRMSVVLAGSAMHFAMAFAALLLLHGVVGWAGPTEAIPWDVEEVLPQTPAESMGLQAGDRIVEIEGFEIESFGEVVGVITDSGGRVVDMVIDRNDQLINVSGEIGTQISETGERSGFLGIRRGTVTPPRQGPIDTVVTSVQDFYNFSELSVLGIVNLPQFLAEKVGLVENAPVLTGDGQVSGNGSDENQVVGPIGMVRVGDEIVDAFGWRSLGGLFVAVNIFVGLFNLVPLLPFDGGHAVIATYERFRSIGGRRHHADVAKLLPLTYATVAVLGVLMIITVYSDIFAFTLFS